jgi:chemotaxis protein MotB
MAAAVAGSPTKTVWRPDVARKKHHVEHPDERWLLTYADMITLLMALFMVLYAMSQISKTKFIQVRQTLKAAFTSAPIFSGGSGILSVGSAHSSMSAQNSDETSSDSTIASEGNPNAANAGAQQSQQQSAKQQQQQRDQQVAATTAATTQQNTELATAEAKIKQAIKAAHLQKRVIVTVNERGLIVRLITDNITFGLASYDLQPGVKPVIRTIAKVVEQLPNDVHVDGYTDALPYHSALGNLGLSGDRAASVLNYMRQNGFVGHNAVSVGHGASNPLVPNAPDGAGPRNRRVEIVVVRRAFTGPKAAPTGPLGQPIGPHPIGNGPIGTTA